MPPTFRSGQPSSSRDAGSEPAVEKLRQQLPNSENQYDSPVQYRPTSTPSRVTTPMRINSSPMDERITLKLMDKAYDEAKRDVEQGRQHNDPARVRRGTERLNQIERQKQSMGPQ